MRTPPILPYSGLTMMLSYPSRFDFDSLTLLSGYAGNLVAKGLGIPIQSCDIRDIKEEGPFLDNTRVVLLLGEQALEKYNKFDPTLKLNQLRGNPWEQDGLTFIATYLPQDACDMKASYEQDNNPFYSAYDDDYGKGDEKSTKGKTARSNYRFWVLQDCGKAKKLLFNSLSSLRPAILPNFRIYESIGEVISIMYRESNTICDMDIETDYGNMMTVISLSFNEENTVWTIPLVRYDGCYAYSELNIAKFLRALVYVFSRCVIVAHNGSSFDFPFLAMNYKIPPPRKSFDTMLVHARLFPGVEKSLGHCMSLYTWEEYHKNEGVFNPHNTAQERQLWEYNAKDVWGMKLVRLAQAKEIKAKDASASIEQICASVYPYICMSLFGIRYNRQAVEDRVIANQRRLTQLARVLRILVGHDLLPTSNKSCVRYFHDELKLKVVKRTEKGNASLDEKAMYRLAVANSCPTIPLCLEYRRTGKETGTLGFKPYDTRD